MDQQEARRGGPRNKQKKKNELRELVYLVRNFLRACWDERATAAHAAFSGGGKERVFGRARPSVHKFLVVVGVTFSSHFGNQKNS